MDILEVSIVHHICIVLLLLWIFSWLGLSHSVLYFVSLVYLYKVNERYTLRLRRKIQYEERRNAYQRRLLSDSETVRWLNHAVEKVWPICMEDIASQNFLMPLIPWFLDKYKPWTAQKAVVRHLYLGRNPPLFTEIRVLGQSADDDHLVLELGMNFLSGDDMSAILDVQLRKRIGFGIWAKLHVTGMHVEGKVLVGVKFIRQWPYLGRVRICFAEPPYFQMTVKPIFTHGLDVTEFPGIAGWLDKLLATAFEQTLVEPNMLVIDVEKFASSPTGGWFTVDEKRPIAYATVEIVEGADMQPSDMNGLADPYVKGRLGPYRFRTKIQRKTLAPKWLEDFKIPISSWQAPNVLYLEVRDKDHIYDDMLGDCLVNINELRGGQRHDKWLPLKNIKTGRLHLAINVTENDDAKAKELLSDDDQDVQQEVTESMPQVSIDAAENNPNFDAFPEKDQKMADEFEPINIEGQEKTGIWVHHPGTDVSQKWEPRKGKARYFETKLRREDPDCSDSPRSVAAGSQNSNTNSSDENTDGKKIRRPSSFRRGLHKVGKLFHSSSIKDNPRNLQEDAIPTPRPNLRAIGDEGSTVKLIIDESCITEVGDCSTPKSGKQTKDRVHTKDWAKNILQQAGVLSRKDSDKFKGSEKSDTTEEGGSQISDLPIEESLPLKLDPSTAEGGPMDAASPTVHIKGSPSAKEELVQADSHNAPDNRLS